MSGAEERGRRSERARRLLEDPLLAELFEAHERRAAQRWLASRPEERGLRERLYQEARLLALLKGELAALLADGTIEAERRKQGAMP